MCSIIIMVRFSIISYSSEFWFLHLIRAKSLVGTGCWSWWFGVWCLLQYYLSCWDDRRVIIRIRIFTGDKSNDILSPGPVIWVISPICSSHQRGKPSHIILCTISRGKNQTWKGIPIFKWFEGRMSPCKCQFLQWGLWKVLCNEASNSRTG